MIGIGTIGRAAESGGGSTTNQNGQYIALSFYGYILYSSDFGQTFVKKVNPAGATGYPIDLCVSSSGEVLCINSSNNYVYYLSDINSNWTTIAYSPSGIYSVGASYDFNIIIYFPKISTTLNEYYYSGNKGVSFTRYTYYSALSDQIIYAGKLSGDGKVAVLSLYSSTETRTYTVSLDINSHSTSLTTLGTYNNVYYSSPYGIFVSYTGAVKGWYTIYLGGSYTPTYTLAGTVSGSTGGVKAVDSENEVDIYFFLNYRINKFPYTRVFSIEEYNNNLIYTVTNGSNQVFYTVNGPDFKAYSSTGDLLYTTVYPDAAIYGGVSAAISRVIPQ